MAHQLLVQPSAWIMRWCARIPAGGQVLDMACGSGRHAIMLAQRGYRVLAVDRDADALSRLRSIPGLAVLQADLEGGPWPCPERIFDGIVVTNYLHRLLLPTLVDSIAPGGLLLYETFAAGNERFGRPANPDFLLRPGELLDAVRGRLHVIAYEDLQVDEPRPAMVQRICAERPQTV